MRNDAHLKIATPLPKKKRAIKARHRSFFGWINQQLYALKNVQRCMQREFGAVAVNTFLLGILFALPVTLAAIATSYVEMTRPLSTGYYLTLTTDKLAAQEETQRLVQALKDDPRVKNLQHKTKDQIYEEVINALGIKNSTELETLNPFVDLIDIGLDSALTEASVVEFVEQYETDPVVSESEQLISQKGRTLLSEQLFERFALPLAIGLVIIILLVISYMVRIQLLRQTEEIEITRYCGADLSFMRRPFLYWGALLGSMGAATALALVHGGAWLLQQPLKDNLEISLANFPQSLFSLGLLALIVVSGGIIGTFGAWISTRINLTAAIPS